MSTETPEAENMRRVATTIINALEAGKAQLEEIYGVGNVWNTEEMREEFEIESFCAPCCVARRKKDGVRGLFTFQHSPRFYFQFEPIK